MGRLTLTLPRLGETMEEARVTAWLVAPGAAFRRGDVLLEVETDKTVVEVPALTGGTLVTQIVAQGDIIALDQPIAVVDVVTAVAGAVAPSPFPTAIAHGATGDGTRGEQSPPPPSPSREGEGRHLPLAGSAGSPAAIVTAPAAGRPPSPAWVGDAAAGTAGGARVAASPAARAAARTAGVDLARLHGTGRRGRVTGADVAAAASGRTQATVVLLHGLFDDARTWRDLARHLRAGGHCVATPDLPGHGDADDAPTLAAAVAAVQSGLPPGPLILVGHSLGGILAARLASGLGRRLQALILLAPAGLGARISGDFLDGMLNAATTDALARALAMTGGGPMSQTASAQELGRLLLHRKGHLVLASILAQGGIQQVDIAPDLARLEVPVTVVFGTADRILDWRDVARLPPRAAIHLIAGAGHLPHLADPALVAWLVARAASAPDRDAAEGVMREAM